MKRLFMVLSFLLGAFIVNASEKKDQVTVLQLNIWQNATQVEGAFDAIVNEVVAHQPDVITLCEVRNYDGIDFTKRLCDALKDNGVIYYSFKAPVITLWMRFCRLYGIEALLRNTERLYDCIRARDEQAAAEWIDRYLGQAIQGSQQIYSE